MARGGINNEANKGPRLDSKPDNQLDAAFSRMEAIIERMLDKMVSQMNKIKATVMAKLCR